MTCKELISQLSWKQAVIGTTGTAIGMSALIISFFLIKTLIKDKDKNSNNEWGYTVIVALSIVGIVVLSIVGAVMLYVHVPKMFAPTADAIDEYYHNFIPMECYKFKQETEKN
jgi:quinol-cytochrome oxidoreductase complex cytochrome b subunit